MFKTKAKLQQIFLLHLCVSVTVVPQSDEFIFKGFKGHSDNITLNGVSGIDESGILRLTNDTLKIFGHAFYKDGIFFKNSSSGKVHSFSTAFAFGIVPQYEDWCGHGLAFVISTQKELKGALSNQYLGLVSANENISNHFLAIEFDTVKDLELHDISDNHVGIDLNSLISKASVNASYFDQHNLTKQGVILKSGKTIQAWIDYDSIRNELNVTLSLSSTKPTSSILSYKVDLSPFFQEYMYIGFSASTGLLYSSHYIYGWSFKINGIAQSLDLSSLPSLPSSKGKGKDLGFSLAVSISAVVSIVLGVILILYIVKQFKNLDLMEDWERDIGPHRFSYRELFQATKGFGEKGLLGFGGFGRVYKGTLPKTQTEVAVKRINSESKQGLREFISEIASMGRLRHRNLVQLLGWCRRETDLLLVYELMPNGSLDKCLFDIPKMVLTWEQRFKIIKGVASGLLYLHEEWDQAVIHRDIKAANVMLDSELNGRLGDFGLAKLYEHGANISTTRVVGTLGYIAPELTKTGKPTTSSDVFAFGALLLEVVCGRRPVEPKALPEELILVDWVWDKWKTGAILELVDQRLGGQYNEIEAVMVLKLGLMCSNDSPAKRPNIRQVLRYLEGENNLVDEVTAPDEYDRKSDDHSSDFKDLHSHSTSSCIDKACTWSSGDSGYRSGVEPSSMTLLSMSGRGEGR